MIEDAVEAFAGALIDAKAAVALTGTEGVEDAIDVSKKNAVAFAVAFASVGVGPNGPIANNVNVNVGGFRAIVSSVAFHSHPLDRRIVAW